MDLSVAERDDTVGERVFERVLAGRQVLGDEDDSPSRVAVPFACTMPSPAAVNVIPLRVAGRVGSTHLFPHTLTGMVFTMLPAVMVMEVSPSLRARTLARPP